MVSNEEFINEANETVTYSANYLQLADGSIEKFNSKESFEDFEGHDGVATLNIRSESGIKGYKVTLTDFKSRD